MLERLREKQPYLFEGLNKELITAISPGDGMHNGQDEHYFYCGLDALQNIRNVIKIVSKYEIEINNIFDFASGHGRVTRTLKATFHNSHITVCDLDKKGVKFCSEKFGVEGINGNINLDNINLKRNYDLIWCGSLFTHKNETYWEKLLNFFCNNLNINGILIFTTHGRLVGKRLDTRTRTYNLGEKEVQNIVNAYNEYGFGFSCYDYSNDYGISVSKPSWVIREIERSDKLKLINYTECGWAEHQDVVACIKIT